MGPKLLVATSTSSRDLDFADNPIVRTWISTDRTRSRQSARPGCGLAVARPSPTQAGPHGRATPPVPDWRFKAGKKDVVVRPARYLHVSRQTLIYRMRKYNLRKPASNDG